MTRRARSVRERPGLWALSLRLTLTPTAAVTRSLAHLSHPSKPEAGCQLPVGCFWRFASSAQLLYNQITPISYSVGAAGKERKRDGCWPLMIVASCAVQALGCKEEEEVGGGRRPTRLIVIIIIISCNHRYWPDPGRQRGPVWAHISGLVVVGQPGTHRLAERLTSRGR